MRRLSLLALVLLSSLALAQTYRWIDPASGRVMITDTPPPGNVKILNRTQNVTPEADGQLSYATRRAMENFPVTLYTSADCIEECKLARNLLNKRGVPFSEKMVQTAADMEELKTLIGGVFVPVLKVGKQSYKGFAEGGYHNLLDLAGYPASAPLGSRPAGSPAQ